MYMWYKNMFVIYMRCQTIPAAGFQCIYIYIYCGIREWTMVNGNGIYLSYPLCVFLTLEVVTYAFSELEILPRFLMLIYPYLQPPPPFYSIDLTHLLELYGIAMVAHEWAIARIWRRRVTYEWVVSCMYRPCNIWMWHMNESWMCHMNKSGMSNIFMTHSDDTNDIFMTHSYLFMTECNRNETCNNWICRIMHECVPVTYKWVMSYMNETCLTWISRVTHEYAMSPIIESCHAWMSHYTCEWVKSHVKESWMSHVTKKWTVSQINDSYHIWTGQVT